MLRISENTASREVVMLVLEGQLSYHNVEIARETCAQALGQGGQLVLDVAGVTFADRAGVALLQEMKQRQVKLIHCSPFLQEQLKHPVTF